MKGEIYLGIVYGALAAIPQMRFEGRVVSPEEKAELRIEREKKAAAALGLRFESGRWVIPPERFASLATGTRHSGAKTVPSLEEVAQASNLSLEIYDTLHCRIGGDVDSKRLRELGQGAEKAWATFQKIFFGETGSGLGAIDSSFSAEDGGRFILIWVRDRARAQKLRGALEGRRRDVVVVAEEGRAKELTVAEGVHQFFHVLLRRFRFDGKSLPDWYEEGFAGLMDLRLGAAAPKACRQKEGALPIGVGSMGWIPSLREGLQQRRLKPLRVIVGLAAEEMAGEDVLQAVSLVDFLAKRSSLPRFHEEIRANAPGPGSPFPRGVDAILCHERAFLAAIGTPDWGALEVAWRGMVEAQR